MSLSFFFPSAITLGFFLIPCVKNTTKKEKKSSLALGFCFCSLFFSFVR